MSCCATFVSTWLLAARRLCRLSWCRFIADASNVGSPFCDSRLNQSCQHAARAMCLRRPLLHMRLASLPRLSVMHRPEHNIRVQWYSPCNAFAMHAMRPHTSPSGDASQTRSTCKSAVVVVCLERRKGRLCASDSSPSGWWAAQPCLCCLCAIRKGIGRKLCLASRYYSPVERQRNVM